MTNNSRTVIELEPVTNLSSNMNYAYINNISNDGGTANEVADTTLETNLSLLIYGIIVISALIVTFIRSFLFFKAAMLASRNMHATMFHCILLAPMKFFNTNPCGRILNRFSKDMGAIDEMLPKMLLDAIQVSILLRI